MPRKEGWTGRVFEDFEVGEVYEHPLGRTVTTADNIWFTALTMNPNPIHFDHAYAAKTDLEASRWSTPASRSAWSPGSRCRDISQNGVNLGWDEVRMPKPVFEGDTLYARSEVLEKRESSSRPHQGIVRFRTEGYNQDGTVVIEFKRTVLIYKAGHVPEVPRRGA